MGFHGFGYLGFGVVPEPFLFALNIFIMSEILNWATLDNADSIILDGTNNDYCIVGTETGIKQRLMKAAVNEEAVIFNSYEVDGIINMMCPRFNVCWSLFVWTLFAPTVTRAAHQIVCEEDILHVV
jgi:hypothetical protein